MSCFGCFAIIKPDEIGALEFLGTFQKILRPGCHCFLPLSTIRKKSTRSSGNRVRVETKTRDNSIITIDISVQQELFQEQAYAAFYKLSSVERQIDDYVADAVRGLVATMDLDHVFEAKDEIVNAVKVRLVDAMQSFGYHILQVLVVDIIPEKRVKDAMNEIVANRRLREAALEKGEAEKIITVKVAEAQKAKMLLEAEAESQSKVLQARGISEARKAIVQGLRDSMGSEGRDLEPSEVQQLLLVTQYLDTLEKVSQGNSTTVFMPHSISGLAEVQEQIRSSLMQAQAGQTTAS